MAWDDEEGWFGRTALTGAALGAALGAVDTAFLVWLGVEMRVGAQSVTPWVGAFFTCSFVTLGYAVGRLLEARRRLKRSAEVIAAQLAALEESQARLIQSEKMASLGRLTAGVAHEVRNPLGVIRSSASMIMDDLEEGSEARLASAFIREEVDRLNGFVNALLDFSRPVRAAMGRVELDAVARAAELLAGEAVREAGAAVTIEEEGGLPPVEGDADLLTQVVLGLMLNAAQVMAAAECPERVIVARLCRDGEGVAIEVADSGPGVAEADRERVFEPFFTTRPDGTGLGLAMARRVVEVHGGAIAAVPGRGAAQGGAGACLRVSLRAHEEEGV